MIWMIKTARARAFLFYSFVFGQSLIFWSKAAAGTTACWPHAQRC
jgi:hypothetical protein